VERVWHGAWGAAARMARAKRGCGDGMGWAAGETMRAWTGRVLVESTAGNCGQVEGAARKSDLPAAAWAAISARRADMAQWWAPWRRQQAGRLASSLSGRSRARGPSPKSRAKNKERPRRIWD